MEHRLQLARSGQFCPDSARTRRPIGGFRNRPKIGRFPANLVGLGRDWPDSSKHGRTRPKYGRFRAELVGVGRSCPQCRHGGPEYARLRPDLVCRQKCGLHCDNLHHRSTSAQSWSKWFSQFGRNRPRFGRHGSDLAENTAGVFEAHPDLD